LLRGKPREAIADSIHGPVLYIIFPQNRECYMQVPGARGAGDHLIYFFASYSNTVNDQTLFEQSKKYMGAMYLN